MRCVASGAQSGRYLAPMSTAFSLSSPLKGFWKPLKTNTTPSMIWLTGTCCALLDLAFCCLGLGSGLDRLSRFLSVDFCAGEAGRNVFVRWNSDKFCGWRNNLNAKTQTQHWVLPLAVVGLGLCLGVASLPSGEPAGLIFFEGGDPEADCRSLLNSNFLFAGGCEETSNVSHQ